MPVPVDFVWAAPDDCQRQAEVATDVARLAGPTENVARVHAVAVVTKTSAGRWNVQIETASEGGSARRSIQGESCEAIAEATALYLALALDPATIAAPSEAPPPAPSDAERHDVGPVAVGAPERASPAPARITDSRVSLGASSRIDSATLPRAAIGAELSATWKPRPLRFELAVTYWLPNNVTLADAPSIRARFAMSSGALRGCYEREFASLTLAPCAAIDVDHVAGEGFGDLRTSGDSTTWFAGALGGIAAWSFTRALAMRVGLDAEAPLTRPRFYVVGSTIAHRVPAVSARAGIGVELTIP